MAEMEKDGESPREISAEDWSRGEGLSGFGKAPDNHVSNVSPDAEADWDFRSGEGRMSLGPRRNAQPSDSSEAANQDALEQVRKDITDGES